MTYQQYDNQPYSFFFTEDSFWIILMVSIVVGQFKLFQLLNLIILLLHYLKEHYLLQKTKL